MVSVPTDPSMLEVANCPKNSSVDLPIEDQLLGLSYKSGLSPSPFKSAKIATPIAFSVCTVQAQLTFTVSVLVVAL